MSVGILDSDVTVDHEHRPDAVRSLRVWIGVVADDGTAITQRRSVILCMGHNRITLTWRPSLQGAGTARFAIVCKSPYSEPKYFAPIIEEARFIRRSDTVILTINIEYRGGPL